MSIKSGYHLLVANYKQNLRLSHFQLYSFVMGILTAYFVIGMIVYLVVAFALNKWDSIPEDNFGQPLDDSHQQELRNFVEFLEVLWGIGELSGTEVFMFTDNSTAEYGSTGECQTLFELMLILQKLELQAGANIHIIHCSSKRMINQGADGLSRGVMTEGVMSGASMDQFMAIQQSTFERSPEVLRWIRSWCNTKGAVPLSCEGWYEEGQDIVGGKRNNEGMWITSYYTDVRVWAPPPAVAYVTVEELRRARHKRQTSTHIFVCPRLMVNN